MRDKDQVFIYNKAELELIKRVFADNDELLYAIRAVFLQFPLTEKQQEMIKTQVTEPVINILRKRILPEPSDDFPLTQLPSILTTLTNDLKTKDAEDMTLQFHAKQLEIRYLRQQFAVLANIEKRTEDTLWLKLCNFADLTGDTNLDFVHMTAYLFILGYVDPMLNFIKSIAGQKEETAEEQANRLRRDSSK